MASLNLDHVGVQFVLYANSARSLKKSAIKTTVGGLIGSRPTDDRTTVQALDDVCLTVSDGDRLALVGHNGSGKSTLLRTMAGVYHPTSGTCSAEGRRVPLFDISLGADEEATGRENIVLRGLLMGLTRDEIEQRVDEIAEFSGLGDFLDLPTRSYSSGMMVRLLFSIATSIQPEVLLMDEWIAAGDEEFLERANARLRALIDKSSIMVLASHSSELLRSICNRAVLLEGGKIVTSGTVDEVLKSYSH